MEDQMSTARTIGWGLLGSAATLLARRATRRAMHESDGELRLPQAAQRNTLGMMLVLAATAGALMAFGDILREQRQRAAESA
jgi:hypothetical protein